MTVAGASRTGGAIRAQMTDRQSQDSFREMNLHASLQQVREAIGGSSQVAPRTPPRYLAAASHLLEARTGYAPKAALEAMCTAVRVTHQPNAWMGLNVAGLAVLSAEATPRPGAVVFVGHDYDAAGDRRFRVGLVPGASGKDVRLSGIVPKKSAKKVALALRPPEMSLLEQHLQSLHQSVATWRRRFGLGTCFADDQRNPDRLARNYARRIASSTRLTDGLTIAAAEFASDTFGIQVIPICSSDVVSVMGDDALLVLTEMMEDQASLSDKLVWRICPTCQGRAPVRSLSATRDQVLGLWYCSSCNSGDREPVQFHSGQEGIPAFVPRVGLCDRLELLLLDYDAAVSYAGGLEHTVASRSRLARTSHRLPPELVWEPSGMFDDWVSSGKVSEELTEGIAKGRYAALWFCGLASERRLYNEIVNSAR